jgi:regulator of RNase E activity RraA
MVVRRSTTAIAHTDCAAADVERLRRLTTAAVADALDSLGLRTHCLSPALVPLVPGVTLAGRAVTLQAVAAPPTSANGTARAASHAAELAAVDSLAPHDVVVADGSAVECAFWGELLSVAARARGGAGAVVDGWVRDIAQIRALGFPVFARGGSPYDSAGRLTISAQNQPIRCGGVLVHPGDAVIGDADGVAVIPAASLADVLALAEGKLDAEEHARGQYASGKPASAVYQELKVL